MKPVADENNCVPVIYETPQSSYTPVTGMTPVQAQEYIDKAKEGEEYTTAKVYHQSGAEITEHFNV